MRWSGLLALTGTLLLAACATAERRSASAIPWPAAPREFADAWEVIQTAERFPNSAGMQRRRLAAAIEAQDPQSGLDAIGRLAAMGAVLSTNAQAQIVPLLGGAMAPFADRMAAGSAPIVASDLFALIPAERPLIEGLIWDSSRRQLYATSVVGRYLLRVEPGGVSPVASEGFGSLLGGAYDGVRRLLWASSAELDPTPRDRPNFVGLVSIDARGRVRRIPGAPGANPGDVAAARDGTVYASDGLNGAIYRCRLGCSNLETLLPPGRLFSAQGLAFSRDQRLLYIADRRYGIVALERATGRLLRVTATEDVMLDGIDGLVEHEGDLIATQTAYPPARIVRLRLSPDGLAVTGLDILERAHPDWGEVTLMAVAGDRLLYVADAQWDRFGDGGIPNAETPPGPTPIRSLPLH